ncbi:DUF3427 domain-containing protein [Candidatus Lokiarchaeum ossiferum]|uniref:DUF3427 domain-containing protein n=1 Tax=Candidatus Lokiarchaeum ossiferum TaxID=2951803 RepID=UPI00352EDD15
MVPCKHFTFASLEKSFCQLQKNPELYTEIQQVLDICYENIHFVDHPMTFEFPCPLDVHCSYTLDQVLSAMGYYTLSSKPRFSEGVKYLKEKNIDLFFVTLNKSEREYSPSTMYHDYSINEVLFHWQSQSNTSVGSITGQRYISEEHPVLLFVRKYKKQQGITAPYIFLGTAEYVRHEGSKPINIVWRLNTAMPPFLQKGSNKFTIS